jgi:hypothetical protein
MTIEQRALNETLKERKGERIDGLSGLWQLQDVAAKKEHAAREAEQRSKRIAEGLSENAGERTRKFN